MGSDTEQALAAFTTRYCQAFQASHGSLPASEVLYGVPSPCIVASEGKCVLWQPVPFQGGVRLSGVEEALGILVHPDIHAFYTSQFAGDMPARFADMSLTLLQSWNDDDVIRVQENLIGHLLIQKQCKLSPALFIATLDDETEVISMCNLTGEVVRERPGTRQRITLSASLSDFLNQIEPEV